MTEIPRGSRWQRKPGGPHANEIVLVVRTTPNNVFWKERHGDQRCTPVPVFLGQFQALDDCANAHRCERCGSIKLRDTDKYCRACQGLIAAVRRARETKATADAAAAIVTTEQQEGCEMLTTTDTGIIEEQLKKADHASERSAGPGLRWRITGRRVVVQEQTIEVAAEDVISALALIDAQAPGLKITDVHLLD